MRPFREGSWIATFQPFFLKIPTNRIDILPLAGYNIKADYFSAMARWSSG